MENFKKCSILKDEPHTTSGGTVGVYELTDLLSADKQMSPGEFKRQYLGEFKPCPIVRECVAFLRYATPDMIADYKRKGLLTNEDIKAARQILEAESR
jgi:hypothetical protein